MLIVDAHQDIAWNTFGFDRDYRVSAIKHREREAQLGYPAATIGLPDALLGRVGIIFSTLFVLPGHASDLGMANTPEKYHNPRQAYEQALRQMDYYNRLADEDPRIRIIHTMKDLDTVIASWAEGKQIGEHLQGLVVLMEGADPVLEPRQFEEWYERGVRVLGTSWNATRYAGGTGMPGGLTSLGRELLEHMANFNTLLDLSHAAEQAFYESIDQYEGPVIASHSNPRKFCNTDRHLSDDMIRLLAERDGVMGVVLYNRFLSDKWSKGDPRLPLSVVTDIIDYVCQITGSANHVGIGTDFDGGFGAEQVPDGLETTGDLYLIADLLRQKGYAKDDITAIMGGNMIRKLREALPAG
jgi:membrane dipeptidase